MAHRIEWNKFDVKNVEWPSKADKNRSTGGWSAPLRYKYEDGKSDYLRIVTPLLRSSFGVKENTNDKGVVSHGLMLTQDGVLINEPGSVEARIHGENKDAVGFFTKMLEFDEEIIDFVHGNQTMFGKRRTESKEVTESRYFRLCKTPSDPDTYGPFISTKMKEWDGEVQTTFWDTTKKQLSIEDFTKISAGASGVAVITFSNMWFSSMGFGTKPRLDTFIVIEEGVDPELRGPNCEGIDISSYLPADKARAFAEAKAQPLKRQRFDPEAEASAIVDGFNVEDSSE